MLELHDTLKNEHGWDIVALHEAVDELLGCCRMDQPARDMDVLWAPDQVLYAEIVVTEGDHLVGAGRLVWDAESDSAPRITDLCLLKRYRSPFVVDSMLSALIDGYAEQAEGGTTVLAHDGQEIDISERVERLRNIAAGQYEPRVI